MRLLITGAGGMLGQDVLAAATAAGHDPVGLARADLDVTDPEAVRRAFARHHPDVVLHCAAWTDVDVAEANEPEATAVNEDGSGNVAAAAVALGAFTIAVSSDYVFDGEASTPYAEDAAPNPRSAYGRSKLAGERAVAAVAPGAHAIVRASWLFGPHGKNFIDTMLRLGAERDEVTVVDDQVGCPTYTGHLARALVEIAERTPVGVAHVAGSGACSWFDLARETFAQAEVACAVRPGRTADLGRPAPRPAYSVLRSTRPEIPILPDWNEGVRAHLRARAAVAAAPAPPGPKATA